MQKIIIVLAFLAGTAFPLVAQHIHYKLSMPKPQNHYFEVEMKLSDVSDKETEVKMPVWAPGSYLVREFSKNVNLVKAFDAAGAPLKVVKKSKNAWVIQNGSNKTFSVKYEVYSFELSVRTSFLDLTHGYVSGSGVFMYIEKLKNKAGTLYIEPYKDFKKVTTALPKTADAPNSFTYEFISYDQLVDCPIEIGNHELFEFTSEGVLHEVAMYGPGNYDIPQLQKDMAKIVSAATGVFGENPNKKYTFIIHNVVDGQGGLEHTNSTTLSVNRWTYQGSDYIGFLSLVAHEYFHLWNVKRIRPIELGPFNYDEENYTSLLWVMEGFTSYYDELIPYRAGYYSEDEFVQKLNGSINYVEGSEGTRVQPVAHASFDAWVKAYRPNENSANTTMTYYSRGAMLAAILDAKIIAKFNGQKCLDHFLQQLYKDFYKKLNRGFSETEFKTALSDFMKEDMTSFFDDFVEGTKVPPFKEIFEPIGVNVRYTGSSKPNFGASFGSSGSNAIIKSIRANSAAEMAGLSVNDEVIGYNGFRVSAAELDGIFAGMETNESCKLLIARDDILMEIVAKMGVYEKPSYKFSISGEAKTAVPDLPAGRHGGRQEKLLHYWLRTMK